VVESREEATLGRFIGFVGVAYASYLAPLRFDLLLVYRGAMSAGADGKCGGPVRRPS
jgi:hypothetical protein